jgi:hypothetical protein
MSDLHKRDCILPRQWVQMIARPLKCLQGIFEKLVKIKVGREQAIFYFRNGE